MVLLIICIFFSHRRCWKHLILEEEEATFQKALMSLEVFTRVFCPSSSNKEGHRQKNLEADNENFSFPFYDLMGPPCAAHSVNAA